MTEPITSVPFAPVREPIDAEVSARIDVLRAVLIGLIVLCHGSRWLGTTVPFADPGVTFLVTLLNSGLDCVAVPLFFAISGYLLLRKLEATPAAYWRLLRVKALAIGVPFVLFNGIWMVWLLTVGCLPNFASRTFVLTAGIVPKLLGIGTTPLNYPLWFLRDLLEVFALVPLFLLFFRYLPTTGLLLLAGAWFLGSPGEEYSLAGFAFAFYAGGYLARRRVRLGETADWDRVILPLFAVASAVVGLFPWLGLDPVVWAAFKKGYQLVGVAAFWCLSRQAWIMGSHGLHRMAAMSFFVFLTHEPTVSVLQAKLVQVWQPASTWGQLVAYPVVGLAAILGLTWLGWGLARYTPRFYALLVGAPPRLRFAGGAGGKPF